MDARRRPDVGSLLSFAAAPTFAGMALVVAGDDGAASAALCLSGHGGGWARGMAMMYGLMALFHVAPWLRVVARSRITQA